MIVAGPTNPKEAAAINRRYIELVSKKPFVAIKMAMSADGKTATRTNDSRWISGPESRALVHRMRRDFDAVMVGAGTVEKDDPELTAHGMGRDPHRIIIDGRLRISPDSRVVRKKDGLTIVVACEKAERAKALAIQRDGARVLVCGRDSVDLKKLMIALGAMGIRKILIEGGSELNAHAMKAGIVDRLYLFIAPKIIGGRDALPVIGGIGIDRMSGAKKLSKPKVRKIGNDVLLEYKIGK
jgi:diaminohydroxyphosphoribosylaminopyrimidine deaminase/5-amino-6-(5-phosphoribosylamino)uracil reductase